MLLLAVLLILTEKINRILWGRYGHPEATCYLKLIGEPRDRRDFENWESISQDSMKSWKEKVIVSKMLPRYAVADSKRLSIGEPVTNELSITYISVE